MPGTISAGPGKTMIAGTFPGTPSNFSSGKNSLPYCCRLQRNPCRQCCVQRNDRSYLYASRIHTAPSQTLLGCRPHCARLTGARAPLPTGLHWRALAASCPRTAIRSSLLPRWEPSATWAGTSSATQASRNWDISVFKNFTFKERYGVQFRARKSLTSSIIPPPPTRLAHRVPSKTGNEFQGGGPLGFSGLTPDFAAGNPLIGSGENRAMQLGLKLTF